LKSFVGLRSYLKLAKNGSISESVMRLSFVFQSCCNAADIAVGGFACCRYSSLTSLLMVFINDVYSKYWSNA